MVVMQDCDNVEYSGSVEDDIAPARNTFVQALKDKYVNQEIFDDKFTIPKDRGIRTEVTLVGFGKVTSIQKQLRTLTTIDLSGRFIDSAGSVEELDGCLDRVKILNLSDNLFSWREIVSVITYTPKLQELIINGNPALNTDDLPNDILSYSQKNLKCLTLGRVYSDWTSIISILMKIWHEIEQLDLWDNRLHVDSMILNQTQTSDTLIAHITALKLSHNRLENFEWIAHAGPLENLIELDLSKCQLQSIDIDDRILPYLKNLELLNVSYNDLDSWKSVSSLNVLPNLKHLICHENPIFISEKYAKSFTIARLGQIRMLNRVPVTRNIRKDSEIFYLRKMFPDYQLSEAGRYPEFKSFHPRYEELARYYGLPEDLTRKQAKDNYITVDLCLGDKKLTKKLPCDMKVANVRMLCRRLFKLKPSSLIQIVCHDKENSTISYVLDKDGQTLDFFSIQTGQRLLIEELNH